MLARLLTIFLLFFLVGCAQVTSDTTQPAKVESKEPTQSPTPETAPEPAPNAEAETSAVCSSEVQGEIEATINAQVEAFGAADYETAYSYASEFFRAAVSLESFIVIIDDSYGPLITSSNLVFSNCLTGPQESIGIIDAKFLQQNNEVYSLRYLLLNSGQGWRVQGASNLQIVGEGA